MVVFDDVVLIVAENSSKARTMPGHQQVILSLDCGHPLSMKTRATARKRQLIVFQCVVNNEHGTLWGHIVKLKECMKEMKDPKGESGCRCYGTIAGRRNIIRDAGGKRG